MTRGADRAELRRIKKALDKGIKARSAHGRLLAARDLELAKPPSILERGLRAARRPRG